jgi:RNA polymerase sigma factor (sigma-70 family)
MQIGNNKAALTTEQQTRLYNLWKRTGKIEYKEKIALSYIKCITAMSRTMQFEWDNEDILSEMIMVVYDAIDNYDPTKAGIYTYIYRIIYTKLIDRVRSSKRKKKIVHNNKLPIPINYVEIEEIGHIEDNKMATDFKQVKDGRRDIIDNDNHNILVSLLKTMDEKQGKLLEMKYLNQIPMYTIMKELGISRQVYGELESKGLARLKENKAVVEMHKED